MENSILIKKISEAHLEDIINKAIQVQFEDSDIEERLLDSKKKQFKTHISKLNAIINLKLI